MALVCVLIVAGIFTGELWIKNKVDGSGSRKLPKSIWGGRILLGRYHNKGAALNLGQHRSRVVAAVSVALCIVLTISFLFSFGQKGNRLLQLGLAFLLGGAYSNTYDRLKRKYVVDYFSFHVKWKPLRNIVFNLADFCIAVGAMLIVIGET